MSVFETCLKKNFISFPDPATITGYGELDGLVEATEKNLQTLKECLPDNLKGEQGIHNYLRTHALRVLRGTFYWENTMSHLSMKDIIPTIRRVSKLPSEGDVVLSAIVGGGSGVATGGSIILARGPSNLYIIRGLGLIGLLAGAIISYNNYNAYTIDIQRAAVSLKHAADGGAFVGVNDWPLTQDGLIHTLDQVTQEYQQLGAE